MGQFMSTQGIWEVAAQKTLKGRKEVMVDDSTKMPIHCFGIHDVGKVSNMVEPIISVFATNISDILKSDKYVLTDVLSEYIIFP